jgi:hypothetical protein
LDIGYSLLAVGHCSQRQGRKEGRIAEAAGGGCGK